MHQLLRSSKKRLGQSVVLSRIYHETRLRLSKTASDSPILVYQMGKVGSRSIVDSLKSMNLGRAVYHVHFLNEENMARADRMLQGIYGAHYNVNRWCLYESRFVIKHVLQPRRTPIKIISLVREPVARNLSSFFHNLDKFIPDCVVRYRAGRIDMTEITREYLEKFHEHTYPLSWFDDELKKVFGIDVFAADASLSNDGRVYLYKRGDIDVLVIRTEDIDHVARRAIEEFLQITGFRLKQSNLAREKQYSQVYRDFTNAIKLPEPYLARMYESKYASYFYGPAEIDRFRAHWSMNGNRDVARLAT